MGRPADNQIRELLDGETNGLVYEGFMFQLRFPADAISSRVAKGPTMSILGSLKNTKRTTLQHNVYELMKLALMSGEFRPGQPLTYREVATSGDGECFPPCTADSIVDLR